MTYIRLHIELVQKLHLLQFLFIFFLKFEVINQYVDILRKTEKIVEPY